MFAKEAGPTGRIVLAAVLSVWSATASAQQPATPDTDLTKLGKGR